MLNRSVTGDAAMKRSHQVTDLARAVLLKFTLNVLRCCGLLVGRNFLYSAVFNGAAIVISTNGMKSMVLVAGQISSRTLSK